MYIHFGNNNVKGDLFSGEYRARFTVASKDSEHEGTIYFTNDRDGNGFIEWCRGSSGQGTGLRIDLEELIKRLEEKY